MKKTIGILATFTLISACSVPQEFINFGDDEGRFPNDGECDDPRFTGPGVWTGAGLEGVWHDATDCTYHYEMGSAMYTGG